MRTRLGRDLGRALAARRRLLAAGLAAAAVAFALTAVRPAPPPTARVLAAANDLAAGVRLDRTHLTTVALPSGAVPDGALRARQDAAGRLLATPMRAGEPLTDVRLVGPALLAGYGPDTVAAPVRVADAGVVRLLRPGDRVDVLAADMGDMAMGGIVEPGTADPESAEAETAEPENAEPEGTGPGAEASDETGADDTASGGTGSGGTPARIVAPAAAVVAVPEDAAPVFGGEGALVLLATTPEQAARLAQAAVTSRLSVVLRPR